MAGGGAGGGSVFDPGEVVDGLEGEAEEAVDEDSRGEGERVDGVDAGRAVGDRVVACDGEVERPVEVVAAVGVDALQAGDVQSGDFVGVEVDFGNVGGCAGDLACEVDFVAVEVPGAGLVVGVQV